MKYIKYYNFLANNKNDNSIDKDDINFFANHNLLLNLSSSEHEQTCCYDLKNDPDYQKYILMHKLLYKKRVAELCSICKAFNTANIRYLVIKGIILAETYPEPFTRIMGDHDILIAYDDFNHAQTILKELGYSNPNNVSSYKDVTFSKNNCLKIELHHALFDKESDSFAKSFESALWDNLEIFTINDTNIFVPNNEIHFRYIVLHMMKHLNAFGAGLRHFLDIKYFSINYHIDLFEQYDYFKQIGYGTFYAYCISLITHYLEAPVNKTHDLLFQEDDPVLTALADYVAENGVFGHANEEHRIDMRFEKYKSKSNSSKISILKDIVFPHPSELGQDYNYAKSNPILLPFAWIHRIFDKSFGKDVRLKEKLFLFTHDDEHLNLINVLKEQIGLEEQKSIK